MNVKNRWNVDSWIAHRGIPCVSPEEEPTLQRLFKLSIFYWRRYVTRADRGTYGVTVGMLCSVL